MKPQENSSTCSCHFLQYVSNNTRKCACVETPIVSLVHSGDYYCPELKQNEILCWLVCYLKNLFYRSGNGGMQPVYIP